MMQTARKCASVTWCDCLSALFTLKADQAQKTRVKAREKNWRQIMSLNIISGQF